MVALGRNMQPSKKDRPKEDWITISVPALIDERTFEIAQNRLAENKRLSSRNNKKNEYLLSSLLRCRECGYAIYGETSNSRYRRRYYHCMGQDGWRWPTGRACTGHPVRVEALDDLVWEAVKRLIQEPQVVVDEYMRRVNRGRRTEASLEGIIAQKSRVIRNLELEKERLIDLYQGGSVSMKEIAERLTKTRNKIKTAEDEQRLLRQEVERNGAQLKLVEQFATFRSKIMDRL